MQSPYKIKITRTFKGHEGEPCAQGILALNGKTVAEWSEDSWGGSLQCNFKTSEDMLEFQAFGTEFLNGKFDCLGEPFHVLAMNEMTIRQETIDYLVEEALQTDFLKKACKKNTIVLSQPSGNSSLQVLPAFYTEQEVAKAKSQYPGLVIVNERFGLPMLDGSHEHLASELAFNKSACKTKTVFVVMENGSRVVLISKTPFGPKTGAAVRKKYPNCIRILNEDL